MAAVRVDGVVVRLALSVQVEGVAGAVAALQTGGAGDHVHGLQVPDRDLVLAVRRQGVRVQVAVDGGLGTQEDVSGVAQLFLVQRGVGGLREVQAGGIAQLDEVNVGAAPDVGLAVGHRVGRARGAGAERVAVGAARRDAATGDDPAAEDHAGAVLRGRDGQRPTGVGVAVVASDGDAASCQDLAVLVERDVVANA